MKLGIITLASFAIGSTLAYSALRPVSAAASTQAPVSSPHVVHAVEGPVTFVVPDVTIVGSVAKWHPKPRPHVSGDCHLPEGTFGTLVCGEWEESAIGTMIQRCEVLCREAN